MLERSTAAPLKTKMLDKMKVGMGIVILIGSFVGLALIPEVSTKDGVVCGKGWVADHYCHTTKDTGGAL